MSTSTRAACQRILYKGANRTSIREKGTLLGILRPGHTFARELLGLSFRSLCQLPSLLGDLLSLLALCEKGDSEGKCVCVGARREIDCSAELQSKSYAVDAANEIEGREESRQAKPQAHLCRLYPRPPS